MIEAGAVFGSVVVLAVLGLYLVKDVRILGRRLWQRLRSRKPKAQLQPEQKRAPRWRVQQERWGEPLMGERGRPIARARALKIAATLRRNAAKELSAADRRLLTVQLGRQQAAWREWAEGYFEEPIDIRLPEPSLKRRLRTPAGHLRILYLYRGEWFRGLVRRHWAMELLRTEAVRHPSGAAQSRAVYRWAVVGGPAVVLFVGSLIVGLPVVGGLGGVAVGLGAGWGGWHFVIARLKPAGQIMLVVYWGETEKQWLPLPRRYDMTTFLRRALQEEAREKQEQDGGEEDTFIPADHIDSSWYTPPGLHRVLAMSAEKEALQLRYAQENKTDAQDVWLKVMALGLVGTILAYACERQEIVQQAVGGGGATFGGG